MLRITWPSLKSNFIGSTEPRTSFFSFFCPSFFGAAFLRYKKRSSALDVGWDGESGIFFPPKRWGNPPKKGIEKHTPNVSWNTKTLLCFFVFRFSFVFGSLFLLMTFFLEDYIQSCNRDVSSLARNRLLPGTPNNHEISWLFLLDHELQIFMTGKYVCFTIEPSI